MIASTTAGDSPMNTKPICFGTLCLCLGLNAPRAHAANIIYTFSGDVTAVTDTSGRLPASIAAGSHFTGRFNYNDAVAPVSPPTSSAQYFSPGSIEVTIDGVYTFRKSLGPAQIDVWTGELFRYAKLPADGAEPLGFTSDLLVNDLEVALADFTNHDAPPSSVLAGLAIDLAKFDPQYRTLYLRGVIHPDVDPGELDEEGNPIVPNFDIRGSLTSLVLVPEPASGVFAVLALAAWWAARLFRRR
jgi:hypothetical protein